MENVLDLQKPPFDKPVPFIKMFDAKTRNLIMQTINGIKDNAINIIAQILVVMAQNCVLYLVLGKTG